ncbi:serine hydrolase domain-containing protein [Paenibacillus senegalensis]|uniref:serine hydrolase domain-containing protein n=1 Tax=Paenibacillus senegalensis TaxID=1465766 RepID=UPI001F1A756A|nr:serine hydrolase domain-containing protein [Paenibacillus senegalensis]
MLGKTLNMRLVLSLLAGIVLFSNVSSVSYASELTAEAPAQSLDARDVEQLLDAIMKEQMEEHHVPNATVSVVADGEVILAKGYGYADLDKLEPVDAERTLFRIGSTSKLFTWTAVMQLVEQGKLDLDTDVNQYLDFEIPAELEIASGSSELQPITLKHLMSHTPGFEDYSTSIFLLNQERMPSFAEYMRDYRPSRVFPAGEMIAYSNYGTALAGYIVEQVTGLPFAEYVETHLYAPLDMRHSTFRQPLPEAMAANMAKAYRYVDGEYRQGEFEYVPEPAGSMSSSAADMARFMLALLQGGESNGEFILEAETVERMLSPLFSHHPSLNGMAYGFIEGTFNERHVLLHPGSTMLFNTALYLLPEERTGLFISHSGGNHFINNEVFQAFMDRYFPSNGMKALSPPDGMLERSGQFVGEYQQNRRSYTTDDKLLSLVNNVIHVAADEEGYLLVTLLGETNRFIEIEPGVYYNLREGRTPDFSGDFRTIVFGSDSFGKTMLMTDGPMSYSKAAWYETAAFNMMLIALSVLVVIGSLVYWGIKAIMHRVRRTTSGQSEANGQPKAASVGKGLAIVYGLLAIIFMLEFLLAGTPHPVYQLPAIAYGEAPGWSAWTKFVPHLMAIIGLGTVIFTGLAWWRRYWRMPGRIHYTGFAGASLILLWIFSFWNMI